jgi:hypothetical protein
MRPLALGLAAVLMSGAAAYAQDVRGVIDNLNRAVNPQQPQNQSDRERQIRAEEERYWRDYYGNRDDWRDRAERDFGARGSGSSQSHVSDRDMDRVFRSEGARRIEMRDLSDADLRRYESLPPGESRRWDDDFAKSARERYQRLSDSERRRYLDDVQREDRQYSGSSSPDRDRQR